MGWRTTRGSESWASMLRVWMEKESSLGVLGLQKSKSTESSPPPTPTPNPQNLPKVAETTRAGTRHTPTTCSWSLSVDKRHVCHSMCLHANMSICICTCIYRWLQTQKVAYVYVYLYLFIFLHVSTDEPCCSFTSPETPKPLSYGICLKSY